MRLVYVAGPYRGKTEAEIALNIASAQQVGKLAADKGWYPAIPHKNTEGFEHLAPDLGDAFWLQGTLELMRRCDAVVLCPGWEFSTGTLGEVEEALALKIPVYKTVRDLPDISGKTHVELQSR